MCKYPEQKERLNEIRRIKGFETSKEIIDLMPVNYSTWVNYFNGSRELRFRDIVTLCEELNVSPKFIIQGKGEIFSEPSEINADYVKGLIFGLSEHHRRQILALLATDFLTP